MNFEVQRSAWDRSKLEQDRIKQKHSFVSFQLFFTMMSELLGTSADEFHQIQNQELMSVTVSYKNAGSLLKCASLCTAMSRPSCLSLSHNRDMKTCYPSDNFTQPRTDQISPAVGFGGQMHLDNGMSYIMLLLLLRVPFCNQTNTLQDENIPKLNFATWPRIVKFTELNLSEFGLMNFSYTSHH